AWGDSIRGNGGPMQVKTLDTASDGRRTVAIVLGTGDEVMKSIHRVVEDQGIEAAAFTAIGAFERMTLGYFQWESGGRLSRRSRRSARLLPTPATRPGRSIACRIPRSSTGARAARTAPSTVRPTMTHTWPSAGRWPSATWPPALPPTAASASTGGTPD